MGEHIVAPLRTCLTCGAIDDHFHQEYECVRELNELLREERASLTALASDLAAARAQLDEAVTQRDAWRDEGKQAAQERDAARAENSRFKAALDAIVAVEDQPLEWAQAAMKMIAIAREALRGGR